MEVSVYCLGAMMFGHEGNGDHDECSRMIDRALDEGINFIDTADAYSDGESEEVVGKQLDSLLAGVNVVLDDETLDAIDEIVRPGLDVYTPDHAWHPVSLTNQTRRRRTLDDRRAA
jgi:Aldo/keto reductase family